MRASGEIIWKKCADIAQQLRCIVKLQRFDLFKSGLFWSKPNGGTRLAWPNSKTILDFNSRIMTKSCHVTPYANDRCEKLRRVSALMRAA